MLCICFSQYGTAVVLKILRTRLKECSVLLGFWRREFKKFIKNRLNKKETPMF